MLSIAVCMMFLAIPIGIIFFSSLNAEERYKEEQKQAEKKREKIIFEREVKAFNERSKGTK